MAQIDRSTLYEGESVSLRISSDAPTPVKPDLSALENDFTITSNSTSSQYSFINGQQSHATRWTILLTPKRKGNIRIPPIHLGSEATPAFTLTVDDFPEELAAALAEQLFIDVEVDVNRPIYVQQQIPYTLKFFYTGEIDNGSLDGPEIEDAVIEKLGKDKRYRETRNGTLFNVIERHFVISAEKSGQFTIPPSRFKGHASIPYPDTDKPDTGTLDNRGFINLQPFTHRLSRIDRPVQAESEAFSLQVKPRPNQTAKHWLPAEQLQLLDSWASNPPRIKTGEPVTRTVTIQTKGLTGSQLPSLDLPEPQGARIYSEPPKIKSQTDGETVYGSSIQSFTYISSQLGILTVPAVTLEWWDVEKNKMQTASLPKWEINVTKGNANPEASPAIKPDRDNQTVDATDPSEALVMENGYSRDILVAFFVLMFITTGILFFNRQRRATANEKIQSSAQKPDINVLLGNIEKDCLNRAPDQAAKSLLALAQELWRENPPKTLGEIALQIQEGKQTILELDRQLYGKNDGIWDSRKLLALVKQGLQKKSGPVNPSSGILRPLYPQH